MGSNEVEDFKDAMMREFEMTDLGLMKFGLEIRQGKFGIFVSQERI